MTAQVIDFTVALALKKLKNIRYAISAIQSRLAVQERQTKKDRVLAQFRNVIHYTRRDADVLPFHQLKDK